MRAETFVPVLIGPDGTPYIRKRPPHLAVRGSERGGIAASDWNEDAVYTNAKTSPRFEIPRVIVKTMRLQDAEHLNGTDLTIYWFLFAAAREQGIHKDRHSVKMSALAQYLGIRSLSRIRDALMRLNTANVRYDCNQDGTRRQACKLIDIAEFDANVQLKGGDLVYFELPSVLRRAVQKSKDYAMVDINALPRLASKIAITLYIRLCYLAGQNSAAREPWEIETERLAEALSFPKKGYRRFHFERALEQALVDIYKLEKLHRRFDFDVMKPDDYSDKYTFDVGTSAKRLAEVAPAELPDEAFEKIYDRNGLVLEKHQYPSTTLLRQASTWLKQSAQDVAPQIISSEWRTDVWGAKNHGDAVCGLNAATFLERIEKDGLKETFEWWLDRLSFNASGCRNRAFVEAPQEAKPLPAFLRPKLSAAPVVETNEVEMDAEVEDDVSIGGDYGYREADPAMPTGLVDAEDIDDADIPF